MCPTGQNMVRRKKWTSDRCPICKVGSESHLHILQCPNHQAITERRRLFDKMLHQLVLWNTCPVIIHILSTACRQWFTGETSDAMDLEGSTDILNDQLALGWDKFWEGRIATAWGNQQFKYLQDTSPKFCLQRHKKWRMLFATAILQCSYGVWSFRNKVLHDSDDTPNNINLHLQLDDEIRRLWADGPDKMAERDRIQFHGGLSLSTLLTKRLDYKTSWISYVKAARTAWREQQEWNRALLGDEWDSDPDL